jgi:PilZ domain
MHPHIRRFNVVKLNLIWETANMRERRKSFRVEWSSEAKIYDLEGRFARQCIVSNFSNGGAKIIDPNPSEVPDEFILRISSHCRPQKCHVTRRLKDSLAVEFTADAKGISELVLVDAKNRSVNEARETEPSRANIRQ